MALLIGTLGIDLYLEHYCAIHNFHLGVLQVPVDLVIDHSVRVDVARCHDSLKQNMGLEFSRNKERFSFFKWASSAFNNMLVLPPGSGILHQVYDLGPRDNFFVQVTSLLS